MLQTHIWLTVNCFSRGIKRFTLSYTTVRFRILAGAVSVKIHKKIRCPWLTSPLAFSPGRTVPPYELSHTCCPPWHCESRRCLLTHLTLPSFIHLSFQPTPSTYQRTAPLGLPQFLPKLTFYLCSAFHSLLLTQGHLPSYLPPPLTFSPLHQFFLLSWL